MNRALGKCSTLAAAWLFAAALTSTATGVVAQVTVSLTEPAAGASYVPPVNVTISATASAGSGYTMSKVEFFYGTTLIGTDTTSPYSIVWNNAPSGQHVLTAKATAIKKNSPDQTATSTPRNITINAPPSVSVTPEYLEVTMPPPPITVTATVSDSDGTIARVEFWEAEIGHGISQPGLLATVTTPPYTFIWNMAPPYHLGDGRPRYRALTVIAFDNLGGSETAFGYPAVLLDAGITVVSPANGATYSASASIPLAVATTPADWPIERVQYYNGTTLIGEVFSAPYSMNWQNVTPGSYSLTARMISVSTVGYYNDSAPVNVTVTPGVPKLHFIHTDHLNTPRLVANQNGQPVWRWDQQEPFGVNAPDENPSALGSFEFPLRLPGQYADKETNLNYNYYRNYDPALGRYIEADLIGLNGGLNLYRYVEANPLANIDPTGLVTCTSTPANFNSTGCKRVRKDEKDDDEVDWRQDPPIILNTWTVPLPRFGFGLSWTDPRNPVVPSAGRTTEYEEIQLGFFNVQRLYRRNVLTVTETWECCGGQTKVLVTKCTNEWTATNLIQRSGFGTRSFRKSLN